MSIAIENIQSQMRKGMLEYCILSVIKEKESYPTDIIEKLKKANLIVIEGTLYPLLTRLKNADLLNYRWEESSGGPPRKYFTITEKGIQFLEQLQNSWLELSASINSLTQISKS